MERTHQNERKQFEKLFRQVHIDRSDDRLQLLDLFLQTEKHVTADELRNIAISKGFSFSDEFVEDALDTMCRFGFAKSYRFGDGTKRYEHRHLGIHHDHMICTCCRKIMEFTDHDLELRQIQVADDYGFHMLQHRMELYGICADCLSKSPIPLTHAVTGQRMIISKITGGVTIHMRARTMGLRENDAIEVMTNLGGSRLLVASGCNRIVVGRGMAEKILVTGKTPEADNQECIPVA